jgi:phosphatidate cytidylyltransferase
MKQFYIFLSVFITLALLQIIYIYAYKYMRKTRKDIAREDSQIYSKDAVKLNNDKTHIHIIDTGLDKDSNLMQNLIPTDKKLLSMIKDKDFILDFGSRLKTSWILYFAVMIPFCFGFTGMTLFFLLVSFLALREFVSVMHLKASDYWPIFCSFYVFLPLQYFFVLTDAQFLFYIFIPVYVFLLSPMLSITSDDDEQFFERASKFQWAQIACIYCISYIPAIGGLVLKNGSFESTTLLLFFMLVVLSSDTMQYIFGKIVGKRKISPKLSPNKTYEGFVYGVTLSTLFGMSLYWLTPFLWWQAGLLSLLISVIGVIGGLIMSGIKRSLKIKDWSSLLGNHGGVLDRCDSMIFAAPLFYHVCKYFFN